MSYTKIETVLKTVLPDAVYKVQALSRVDTDGAAVF